MSKKSTDTQASSEFTLLKLPYEVDQESDMLPEIVAVASKEAAQAYIQEYKEKYKQSKTHPQEVVQYQHYFILVAGPVVQTHEWSSPSYILHP